MAADLERQRNELQRTHRLEAWADMARQVAHEIKNPLTPIQLSSEHLVRVNKDKGEPLTPVLEECVTSILSQVKLLRQISAEFSSFASRPTPHPAPTSLAELIPVGRRAVHHRARRPHDVDIDVPASLPTVVVDRVLLARALTNMIENALHAMPGGGTLTMKAAAPAVDHPALGARHWHGHGSGGAAAHLRAVLLDQSHRHRTRADDREDEMSS